MKLCQNRPKFKSEGICLQGPTLYFWYFIHQSGLNRSPLFGVESRKLQHQRPMYAVQFANTSSGVLASKGLKRSSVPFLRSSLRKNGSGKSAFGARTVSGRVSNSVRAAVEAPAPTTTAASTVSQAEKLLDIVFVATEVGPWSKTGECLNGL